MKTALIVDDSPLARTVLRKMLAENGVAVDEASSAESAIEYLQSVRPDVVFLDHLMPGMDGFEALKAIKANPNTATIPVMMYTSQDGQLYVSQARALGAVDVLPKNLNPADVNRLLRSHHLLIDDSEPKPGVEKQVPEIERPVQFVEPSEQENVDAVRPVQLHEVTSLIRSMMREQTNILLDELQAQRTRMHQEPVTLPPSAVIRSQKILNSLLSKRVLAATVVITLGAAAGFGSLYVHASRVLTETTGQLRALSTLPDISQAPQDGTPSLANPGPSASTYRSNPVALRPYWVENFAFDSIPLDDDRALKYGSVLAELKNEGFSGSVIVEVHEGLFCLNYTSEGSFELAQSDQPAFFCDQIGTPADTVSYARQSALFSNMLADASRDGQFSIETVFHGATRPIVDYPILDYSVTAGDWNLVAAFNQRVSFRAVRADTGVRGSKFSNMDERSNL